MRGNNLKILFVEDDDDIRLIAQLALQTDPSFEVTTFPSAELALEHLSHSFEYYNVGLFDVQLPGMQGTELAKKVKQVPVNAHLRFIFLTASILPSQVAGYLAIGAAGVITKPFDPIELPHKIREILNRESLH